LTSTYRHKDFYSLRELEKTTLSNDSSQVIINPSSAVHLTGVTFHVEADTLSMGNHYHLGDTLTLHKSVKNLVVKSRCLYNMDWHVALNNNGKSTLYILELTPTNEGENISLDNIELLLSEGKLLVPNKLSFISFHRNELWKQ
jgi:hypothetical protein